MSEPRIISRVQIAERLGMTYFALERVWPIWLATPGFPGPVPGYRKRYDWQAIEAFLVMVRPPELGGGAVVSPLPKVGAPRIDWQAKLAAAADRVAGRLGAS